MNWKMIQRIKLFLQIVWRCPERGSGIPKQYQLNRIDARTAWSISKVVMGLVLIATALAGSACQQECAMRDEREPAHASRPQPYFDGVRNPGITEPVQVRRGTPSHPELNKAWADMYPPGTRITNPEALPQKGGNYPRQIQPGEGIPNR